MLSASISPASRSVSGVRTGPAGRPTEEFAPAHIRFTPLDYWISPRTRARYPVAQRIEVGNRIFESRPLMPDQEFDARARSATAYWEGASILHEAGQPVGRGYLELTGYAGAVPGGPPIS